MYGIGNVLAFFSIEKGDIRRTPVKTFKNTVENKQTTLIMLWRSVRDMLEIESRGHICMIKLGPFSVQTTIGILTYLGVIILEKLIRFFGFMQLGFPHINRGALWVIHSWHSNFQINWKLTMGHLDNRLFVSLIDLQNRNWPKWVIFVRKKYKRCMCSTAPIPFIFSVLICKDRVKEMLNQSIVHRLSTINNDDNSKAIVTSLPPLIHKSARLV